MHEQEQKLQQEILADAGRKAARVLERATQDAAKLLAQADAEAAQLRERALADAAAEGQARGRAIRAGIQHELLRRWLLARETVLTRGLDQVRQQLERLSGGERGALLEQLLAEAATTLGDDPDVRLIAAAADAALLTRDRLAAALARAGRPPELAGQWRVCPDDTVPAGFIATAADGRLRVDQTFQARLARLAPALRATLAAGLDALAVPPDLATPSGATEAPP